MEWLTQLFTLQYSHRPKESVESEDSVGRWKKSRFLSWCLSLFSFCLIEGWLRSPLLTASVFMAGLCGFWKRTSSAHTFSQRFVTLIHGWSYLGFSTSDMHTHKNTHTVWRSDRHRCPVFDLGAMLPRKVCLTASLSPLVSRLDHLATHIQLRAQGTCRCCHYSHKQGYSHTRSSVRQ